MDVIGSGCVAVATLALGLALMHRQASRSVRAWFGRRHERAVAELARARLDASPRTLLLMSLLGPALGALAGLTVSPIGALLGIVAGVAAPRLYVRWLVQTQVAHSERLAPQVLHALTTQLAGGATYLEAIRHARRQISDPWLGADLDAALAEFLLSVPMEVALTRVRTRIGGRSLGLIIDTLALCCACRLPAASARLLLQEMGSTVHFVTALREEVRARATGQQLQVWLLALLVPGIFCYFRLVAPDLLRVLDTTDFGRYVLVPAAALLEGLGLYLSYRVTRLCA